MAIQTRKFWIWYLFFLAFVVLFSLEIGLRVFGYTVWEYQKNRSSDARYHQFDPVLGWKNKPGRYKYQGFSDEVNFIYLNIDSSGGRVTSDKPVDAERSVVLSGGSWIHGWALSDHQTLAWKLQAISQTEKYFNFGTGAYGTYQSYLAIKDQIEQAKEKFDVVIYGYMGHHVERNVASASWQKNLEIQSPNAHVWIPFCGVNETDKLDCHIEHYPKWLMREYSVLVNTLNDLYARFIDGQRLGQMRRIMELLLMEFEHLVESNGGEFLVLLFTNPENHPAYNYEQFLIDNDINYVDCSFELTDELRVKGEGHPNERMNDMWLECVSPVLEKLVSNE